jgi:hypothetical protein
MLLWVNPLFLWPFSIVFCERLLGKIDLGLRVDGAVTWFLFQGAFTEEVAALAGV